VHPLLAGASMTACVAIAFVGFAMMRDRGPAARFDVDDVGRKPRRDRSRVARLYDFLSTKLAPRVTGFIDDAKRERIRRRLEAAGRPGSMTLEGYVGRKAAYTLVMAVAGLLFAIQGLWVLFLALVVLGWFQIDIWLAGVARKRQQQIDRDLPDFLDILAVTVAAGVGFRPAIARVSEAVGGPVSEEMITALRQMDLGMNRRHAFSAVKSRNRSEHLNQFVTALLQAEELGVPLADALGDLAGDMRRSFHQSARRRAARAAPRVSLITSTVIVPGSLIVILASVTIGSGLDFGNLLSG
jgi:tight adherence protein C